MLQFFQQQLLQQAVLVSEKPQNKRILSPLIFNHSIQRNNQNALNVKTYIAFTTIIEKGKEMNYPKNLKYF